MPSNALVLSGQAALPPLRQACLAGFKEVRVHVGFGLWPFPPDGCVIAETLF